MQRYFLSDFVEIQRKSFFELLEKGLLEEFQRNNPIRNKKKTLEIFFYPEYYKLTLPEYSPRNAILNSKSYTSKLYIPVQLTDKINKTISLKWIYIGNLPLMTKRGHFILNGAPRVIINQILRSPGLYYQEKLYEQFKTKWDYKAEMSYKRYYADFICQRGTWLRLEMDKEKCLWAQMKKGPKIPLFWFLIAMGLTEKVIFNTILQPGKLLENIENFDDAEKNKKVYNYVKTPPQAWAEIYALNSPGVSIVNSVKKPLKSKKKNKKTLSKKSKPLIELNNLKKEEKTNKIKKYTIKRFKAFVSENKSSLTLQEVLRLRYKLSKGKGARTGRANFIFDKNKKTNKKISSLINLAQKREKKAALYYIKNNKAFPELNSHFKIEPYPSFGKQKSSLSSGTLRIGSKPSLLLKDEAMLQRKNYKAVPIPLKSKKSYERNESSNLEAQSNQRVDKIQKNFLLGPSFSAVEKPAPYYVRKEVQNEKKEKESYQKTLHSDLSFGQLNVNSKSLQNNNILQELGRKWIFNKFMNKRNYDLGKLGRFNLNRKLGIFVSEKNCTLTPQDLLYATDYLIKVENGINKIDDIDHLRNRRVRTSGELIQIQIGVGVMRLEKEIRDKLNKASDNYSLSPSAIIYNSPKQKRVTKSFLNSSPSSLRTKSKRPSSFFRSKEGKDGVIQKGQDKGALVELAVVQIKENKSKTPPLSINTVRTNSTPKTKKGKKQDLTSQNKTFFKMKKTKSALIRKNSLIKSSASLACSSFVARKTFLTSEVQRVNISKSSLKINQFLVSKAFNSALREFFGSSPLSQFMDQINPLAELTHKRRLSSMGPGGVTRDSATMAIRGIHPTHYGRICPVETPEGKNTGLVSSMTAYSVLSSNGFLYSPFYKLYKGQVQKQNGMIYFSADEEEKLSVAAADINISPSGFLPNSNIPVRIGETFTKISRLNVDYIALSPIQMLSIATSLIPFLEHDDANRVLMGSNMQRQAVPLIRPERPIVGTGLEAKAVSDSGHVIQTKKSGFIRYVSGNKIIVYSF